MCAPVRPIRGDRNCHPTEVVKQATAKHDPTGNWSDRGAIDHFAEVIGDLRMYRELAKVR